MGINPDFMHVSTVYGLVGLKCITLDDVNPQRYVVYLGMTEIGRILSYDNGTATASNFGLYKRALSQEYESRFNFSELAEQLAEYYMAHSEKHRDAS